MIFDTHAHYDDEQFNEDRVELLNSMEEQGVGTIINVSATYKFMQKGYRTCKGVSICICGSRASSG